MEIHMLLKNKKRKLAIPLAVLALTIGGMSANAAESARPDITIADFEGQTYGAGWTATGDAFGNGPAQGTLPNQNVVSGYVGHGLVNSFNGGDKSTGTLQSPPFILKRRYLRFLIGGGSQLNAEYVELIVDGKVIHKAIGDDSEELSPAQWDVSALEGKTAVFCIVDNSTTGWGHILVDQIVETDQAPPPEGNPIAKAMAAITQAIPTASADPNRPVYHFHAPAQWMNDPNGFIYYDGWYHVFYQFNPYSSNWGNMHWGHARSRNLVDWQQLPVALWPSHERGEEHVFSGSLFKDASGTPRAFYTSIPTGDDARDPEIWSAEPLSDSLLRWRKLSNEPVISEVNHGAVHVDEWRDPFLVSDKGVTYLVTGGEINGRGVVLLYRALDGDLTNWKYLGPLFHYPDPSLPNIECPNLVRVGDKWVLLVSVNGQVEYFTGEANLALGTFTTLHHGVLEQGSYASQATPNNSGQTVEFAWIRPIGGPGWSGCLTLPNVLSVDPDGTLIANPAPALEKLRGSETSLTNVTLSGTLPLPAQASGSDLEIVAQIKPGSAFCVGLNLRASADGSREESIRYYPQSQTLSIPGFKDLIVPIDPHTGTVNLHLYLDRSLLDVYGDGGRADETGALTPLPLAGDTGVSLFATGGSATVEHLTVYRITPAKFDLSEFH